MERCSYLLKLRISQVVDRGMRQLHYPIIYINCPLSMFHSLGMHLQLRLLYLLWYISKAYPAIEQTITLIIVPITAYLIELMKSTVKALLLKRVFKLLKSSMPGSNLPAAMSVLELVTDINIK